MDDIMDMVWDQIVDGFEFIAALIDAILAPLNHHIGPTMVILMLVVLLVALTKMLARMYNTKRYAELKKNYEHWFELRKEAMACEDRDKGKALARNIDQAQLNKAYYDYFFEGFLKSIITSILPILFTAAYINRAYSPENLIAHAGQAYIFIIPRSGSDPVLVSAFFWFVICLFMVFLAWFIIGILLKRHKTRKDTARQIKAELTPPGDQAG